MTTHVDRVPGTRYKLGGWLGRYLERVTQQWRDEESGFIGLAPEVQETLNPVSVEMEAGDLLCFTQRTPHRALSNQADAVRWSMDLRFEATDQATESGKTRGFIARSPSNPTRVGTYPEWLELWKDQAKGTY